MVINSAEQAVVLGGRRERPAPARVLRHCCVGTSRGASVRTVAWRTRCLAGSAVVVALAGALVSGCRGGSAPHAAGVRVVPWVGAVPPELREVTVRAAARCRARDLRVDGPGLQLQPAAHGGAGTVRLRNAGKGPCRLDERPAVRFVGAPVGPAQREVALPAGDVAFPGVVPAGNTLLALAPEGVAVLGVEWRNWCVGTTTAVPPRAMRIELAGGAGSLDVNYSAVVSCEDRQQPSTVGVRPFQPAPLALPGAFTDVRVAATVGALPGRAAELHGRRGEVVAFGVEIRNLSATRELRFDRCPAVAVLLAPVGRTEVYQLNCAGAAPVAAGAAEVFEMRVRVPADAPVGSNGLFWALDVTGSRPLEVVSHVIVDA
jgi:Protein of unknown function (DUF4232)